MTKIEFRREFVRKDEKVGEALVAADVGGFTVNGKELPTKSVEYLLNFAFQSLQDAYAGAKSGAEAKGMWDKKYDALLAGTIGTRIGSGIGDATRLARRFTAQFLQANVTKEAWKAFKERDEDAQNTRLDALYEEHKAHIDPLIAAYKKELARKAEQAKALAGKIDIAL